jgi:hypothetical protein
MYPKIDAASWPESGTRKRGKLTGNLKPPELGNQLLSKVIS